jgi:hypothetical protein
MDSYADPAKLPEQLCQNLVNFTSARAGLLRLGYQLKSWGIPLTYDIDALVPYNDPASVYSALLLFSGTNIYKIALSGSTYQIYNTGAVTRGRINFITPTLATASGPTATAGIRAIQYKDELIVVPSSGGSGYRIYIDSGGFHFYQLGLVAPGAFSTPTLVGGFGPPGLTVGATYDYVPVWVDERGRESSVGPSVTSPVITAGNQALTITIPSGTTGGTTGRTQWGIYRRNPGSSVYNLVAYVPVGTTTYVDGNTDAIVDGHAPSSTAGENDPPNNFSALCVWKDRLVLNDATNQDFLQISNAGSPTRFSSLPLPTNVADGIRTRVASSFGDQIVGMHSFGSVMLVFKLRTVSAVWGDDITSFAVRPVHERGCVNADSIVRLNERVFILLEDGVWSFGAMATGYGILQIQKDSLPMEDYFRGFAYQNNAVPDPGAAVSVEVAGKASGKVQAWYHSNRYYLSIASKTWRYDTTTEGWSDTGWGLVRAAAYVENSLFPETVFLSVGTWGAYGRQLAYFCATDKAGDSDYPAVVSSRLVARPFDGGGASGQEAMRSRRKQAVLLQVTGSAPYAQAEAALSGKPQKIGTVTMMTDAGYSEGPYPIYVYAQGSAIYPVGILFQQGFTGACQGRLLWPDMQFTAPDVTISNMTLEYLGLS